MRIYPFSLKSLPNHLTLYQFLSPLKVPQRSYNLRVCRNHIFLQINQFRPDVTLHPRSPILLVCGIVETALACAGEGIFPSFIHLRFIYNLNNIRKQYSFHFDQQINHKILVAKRASQLIYDNNIKMQGQQNQYKQPLLLLRKYHQYLQNKPQEFTQILVHERLVYLIASALQNKQPLPKGLSLLQELTTFINKINIKVMAANTLQFNQKLNLISKCIDMLFYKAVRNNLRPQEKLLQLRALSFNNLSCIYKENRQNEDALKALQVALQIEEGLLEKNFEDTYKSIASTYINKCVILSHLSLHEQAIETIKTSLESLQKYQNRFGNTISEKEQGQIKHMTLLAYYNIAVQHEHLGHSQLSIKFYQLAFKEAKEVGNWTIKNQIITALKKLKAKK